MTTGPEHFREAERLIRQGKDELRRAAPNTIDEVQSMVVTTMQIAQAHAALAQAAEKRKPLVMVVQGDLTEEDVERISEAIRAAYDDTTDGAA